MSVLFVAKSQGQDYISQPRISSETLLPHVVSSLSRPTLSLSHTHTRSHILIYITLTHAYTHIHIHYTHTHTCIRSVARDDCNVSFARARSRDRTILRKRVISIEIRFRKIVIIIGIEYVVFILFSSNRPERIRTSPTRCYVTCV